MPTVRFASGARGTVEMARSAVRRPCDFTVEFNSSRGTLVFDYRRLNELRFGDSGDDPGLYGMRRIRAEHPTHPYAAQWWPISQGVGYGASFANQVADLLAGWPDEPWHPGFREAAAVQAVCDAMELLAAQQRWVAVSELMSRPGPPAWVASRMGGSGRREVPGPGVTAPAGGRNGRPLAAVSRRAPRRSARPRTAPRRSR